MVNPLLGDQLMNKNYVTEDGIFTQDQLLVAQMINDTYPMITLNKVESHNPLLGEKPYAVLVQPMGQPPYPLFFVDAEEINYNLYTRVVQADMAKQGRSLEDQLAANEMSRQLFLELKHEEEMAEKRDLAKSILKSKLHTYTHNGKKYRS